MWFKTIFNRDRAPREAPVFDEAFLRRLQRLSLQAQQTLRGRPAAGEHLSRQRLPSSVFADHRPYSAGDDYRHIDWHAYASQEQYYVKLGETEQQIRVHVLLDVSPSMAWGKPAKLLTMQRLAGALGYLALTHGDRLTVAPFASQALPALGPISGKGRVVELFQFLTSLKPRGQTSLHTMLEGIARAHPGGGILVLCSDLLSADELTTSLRLLVPPRWQVLVLHLLDPREIAPEAGETVDLEDSETGALMTVTLDAQTLTGYRTQLDAWRARLAADCARRGATYATIQTDWPIERQVIPYLRRRRVLQ